MKRRSAASITGIVFTLAGVLISTALALPSGEAFGARGTVWVADEGSNSLTVIDAATGKVVTTLTGIGSPHNVQVSPDGRSIWAVSGSEMLAVRIDARTYRVTGTVRTGEHPAHVVVTPDGNRAFVTNSGDNTLTAIDIARMKPISAIPVGRFPHGLRPSTDGRWLLVADAKSTTTTLVDTRRLRRVADIEVGRKPVQVAFEPSGRFAYVTLNAEDAVAKIDLDKRRVIAKLAVGKGPIQVFASPDGKHLLVANQGTEEKPSTTVSLVDTATFSVAATLASGLGAHGVAIDPASRYAYITNTFAGNVSVIDLARRRVVARIPVGKEPGGISFSPLAPSKTSDRIIHLSLPTMSESMPGMGN